jgi:hypothetical protein
MKYKHLPSALHNFGHSFVSLMNYVDDEYIVDVLERIAREEPSHEVAINFATGLTEPKRAAESTAVAKSIRYWQEWLPKLFLSQDVQPAAVSEVRVRFRLTNVGREVIVESRDDRGHEYKVFVKSTL